MKNCSGAAIKEEEHLNFQETGSRTGALSRPGCLSESGRSRKGDPLRVNETNHFESRGGGERSTLRV